MSWYILTLFPSQSICSLFFGNFSLMSLGSSGEIVKLDLDVVYCSSEDSFFRADEVCRTGSGVNRGWQSGSGIAAPHQLGLRLAGDCFIDRLQVISHDCKIASKVEVHVAEPVACNIRGGKISTFHDATFRILGYFAFRRNEKGARCGELKCISVGCRAIYMKLVLHEPHNHALNTHQQVGLVSVVALGQTKIPYPGTSLRSLPTGAASAAEMDMMCDAAILEKIRNFDSSKRKAISDEDLESARRINEQIDVMIPLAIQTKSLEQQKEFAIVSNDFDRAQKLKAQIQRIRTFVHSLKVGMPLEEGFSLERFDEYVSGQLYRSPPRQRPNADAITAVSQSEQSKGGSSPSVRSSSSMMVLVEDDEVAIAEDILTPHDVTVLQKVQSLLKDKKAAVEHVSHARASRIQGWEDANRGFGLYFACCLFSKNHNVRETAVRLLLTDGFTLFQDLAGGSAPFFCSAVASYLASSSYGPQESVQTALVANVDLICALASEHVCGSAGSASLVCVSEALCTALLQRSADSNKKIKEAAVRALRALASCTAVGLDRVCSIILDVEVKRNFRLLLAKIDFLLLELPQDPNWIHLPSLSFSNVLHNVLRPAVEGVSPELRARGADLFALVLRACGTDSPEVRKALKALRPSQLSAVEAAYGSKIPLDPSLPSQASSRSPTVAATPKRRTVEDTLAKEPDLGNVYKFSSRTPEPQKHSSHPKNSVRSSSVEPSTEPRVTIASTVEDVPSKRASSIRQKLTGAIRDSRKPSRPPRRTQPEPVKGKCQFCHASVDTEEMLDHFMELCPMMCLCPLCRNPVEVLDVHWHLAEDCHLKSQIRQCHTCFECFKPVEFNQHTAAQSCTPYDHAVIVCPLCQVVMPRDDLFWEDHMLQEPYCEKNPRRPLAEEDHFMDDDAADPEESAPRDTETTGEAATGSVSVAEATLEEPRGRRKGVAFPIKAGEAPQLASIQKERSADGAQKAPQAGADADQLPAAMEKLIEEVCVVWRSIHEASEIGSPSDEDLENLERLKRKLAVAKKQIVTLLHPMKTANRKVKPNNSDVVVEFLDRIVKETDLPEMNRDLVRVLLTVVSFPWDTAIQERDLMLAAATDGSLDYLTIFLDETDVLPSGDVITACFYNLSVRINLAWILFSSVELLPFFQNEELLRGELQQFFEAVASKKRAIPKERTEKREELLKLMLVDVGEILEFGVEGSDGHTPFTRALAEGDFFVAELILGRLKIQSSFDINKPKSDKSTPLMQAVYGNSPEVVQLLLDTYKGDISRAIPPGSDFPGVDVLSMAQQLQRHPKIIEMLKFPQPLSEVSLLLKQKTEDID
jgi:centrosomal protein CEP104